MIKLKYITVVLVIWSMMGCSSESAPDCFQRAGDLVRDEVEVADFTKITVFENVNLILKDGEETKVEVETGAYLRNDVSVSVEDGRLILENANSCNFVRDYGLTTVYVTAPDISEIRSSTGLRVASDGVLSYDSLRLISESFISSESETTDGEFDLDVDCNGLNILVNGITYFKLRGATDFLGVAIAAGDSRIEAEDLNAEFVDIDHRGSNDILVKPIDGIKGDIRGTGDVVSFTRPLIIEVEELYKGKLIFKD